MKTLAIAVAILVSTLVNESSARGTINMNKELKKVVKFDKNKWPIKKNETAFVKVSFKINEAGKIEILEMNYSHEKMKSQLTQKLLKMEIKQHYNCDKIYNYNFTFKKI